MRTNQIGLVLMIGMVLAFGAVMPSAQQPPTTMTVTINANGAPASGMAVVLMLVNKGKVPAGTTGSAGQIALDLANMPKVRVEISVEDCPDPEGTHLLITQPGAKPDDRCKKRILGFWLWGNGTSLIVDTGTGTIQVIGETSTLLTPRNLAIIGGGGAGAIIAIAAAGGGDSDSSSSSSSSSSSTSTGSTSTGSTGSAGSTGSTGTTPTPQVFGGTYKVLTVVVLTDPNGHKTFVLMELCIGSNLAATSSGGSFSITGGSPWINLSGSITESNGALNLSGTGTAANRTGVQATFVGTINSSGLMSGTLSVGNNNTLPGGPITYTVTLQKQ